MVERFIELADVVGSALLRLGHDGRHLLSASEVTTIREVRQLLKPFADATQEMSAEKITAASKVIPMVNLMKQMVVSVKPREGDSIVTSLKTALLTELEKRFKYVEFIETYSHATLFHPRFKRVYFQNAAAHGSAIFALTEKVNQIHQKRSENKTPENNESGLRVTASVKENDSIWRIHENLLATMPTQEADNPDGVSGKLRHFLNRPLVARTVDPLEAWEGIKGEYPNLYELASDYLSRIVTSVPSERLSSLTGNPATEERNRLDPSRLGKSVFMSSEPHDQWFAD